MREYTWKVSPTHVTEVENFFNDIINILNDTDVKENKKVIKDVRPATAKKHIRGITNFKPLFIPKLKDVWFYKPATIAWFEDGTKTVAVAGHGDKYDKETGLAICMLKRVLGNKEYRRIMDEWCYKKENMN
jgi:hypothetical protein